MHKKKRTKNSAPGALRGNTPPTLMVLHSKLPSGGMLLCRKIGPPNCFTKLLGFLCRMGGWVQPSLQLKTPFLWPLLSMCSSSESNTPPRKSGTQQIWAIAWSGEEPQGPEWIPSTPFSSPPPPLPRDDGFPSPRGEPSPSDGSPPGGGGGGVHHSRPATYRRIACRIHGRSVACCRSPKDLGYPLTCTDADSAMQTCT